MSDGPRGTKRRLWRAPRENRAVLVAPPCNEAPALISAAALVRERSTVRIGGAALPELALRARGEILSAAVEYTRAYRDVSASADPRRIVIAGDQPEMIHPGKWIKTLVLDRLCSQLSATPLNLIIDDDVPWATAIRAPVGDPRRPSVESIAYDAALWNSPLADAPHEERPVFDEGLFQSFGDRVTRCVQPFSAQPIIREYWPMVLERYRATGRLGLALAQGRHRYEATWGWQSWELPQSRLCDLPSFRFFAAELLLEADRFREVYNAALAEYRRTYRIRSRRHPAPDLERDGEWIEVPFWIWDPARPRRSRPFLRRTADGVEITDRGAIRRALPGRDIPGLAEALATLSPGGLRFRTRALTTTLWARLALSELFIHGIGGANYDRITDQLMERFFGAAAPGLVAVSATMQLPIAHGGATVDDLRRVERTLRELDYQPERHISVASANDTSREPGRSLEAKRRALASESSPENARARCRAIRAANAALAPLLETERQRLTEERARILSELSIGRQLGSRDFAFCLYDSGYLRDFYLDFSQKSCRLLPKDGPHLTEDGSRNEHADHAMEPGQGR